MQAGKSTVLSHLCGLNLPQGTGVVTKCPLQIDCIKSAPGEPSGVKVWSGGQEPAQFQCNTKDDSRITQLIEAAQDEACEGLAFKNSVIHLKVVGTRVQGLQVIDLPGRALGNSNKVCRIQDVSHTSAKDANIDRSETHQVILNNIMHIYTGRD